jgi:hypothetical protein
MNKTSAGACDGRIAISCGLVAAVMLFRNRLRAISLGFQLLQDLPSNFICLCRWTHGFAEVLV